MPIPVTLPPLSPDTQAAVAISARRARDLVVEAREVRAAALESALFLLASTGPDRDFYGDGDFPRSAQWLEYELAEETAKLKAHNTILHFVRPRYGKIMRARLRRYFRLKYLYEAEHPPFSHPEFPQHPFLTMWHADPMIQASMSTKGLDSQPYSREEDPARVLSEDDDEISPLLSSIPLPA
ncbi:hypothetical protein C8R47DRAFT_1223527 [Mycena vitilis]|nr:hypothetical protein C8R47DRAFT_1223527 [Mycena vitilis]